MRHQNLKTTLELDAKSMSEDRLKAQGMFLELLFSHRRTELIGSGSVSNSTNCRETAGNMGKWNVIKTFKMWWPGTELNRRRQPFQGCALPAELPGHGRECAGDGCRSAKSIATHPRSRQTHARDEMPSQPSPCWSVDLDDLGDHALVATPGQEALEPDLHLGVGADHVAELGIGVVGDAQDESRHFAGVAAVLGAPS